MRSIIIGGGKIGYNLLKTLKDKNHKIILIERNEDTCIKIADELDAVVIHGDGTDMAVLEEAGIKGAEVVAAVTGTDEENMVICQIAKKQFNVEKIIARVNNPKNIFIFKSLGINRIVCSTALIADMIEYELNSESYRIIQTLEHGEMVLAEVTIEKQNSWRDKEIKDLVLPDECVIVSVIRDDNVIYPKGNTKILENDKVLFIAQHQIMKNLVNDFNAGGF
ncbi:MAG: potassium channel family protein [Saccharofermentanales bacterium]